MRCAAESCPGTYKQCFCSRVERMRQDVVSRCTSRTAACALLLKLPKHLQMARLADEMDGNGSGSGGQRPSILLVLGLKGACIASPQLQHGECGICCVPHYLPIRHSAARAKEECSMPAAAEAAQAHMCGVQGISFQWVTDTHQRNAMAWHPGPSRITGACTAPAPHLCLLSFWVPGASLLKTFHDAAAGCGLLS